MFPNSSRGGGVSKSKMFLNFCVPKWCEGLDNWDWDMFPKEIKCNTLDFNILSSRAYIPSFRTLESVLP